MKRIYTAVLLFFLLFPFLSLSQDAKELFEGKVATDVLQNNVDQIYTDLKENHPNLYKFISKRALDSKFDSLKGTIEFPISRMEFRYKVLTVLQKIGDGHLTLTMNGGHISSEDYQNYIGKKIRPIDQFSFKVLDMRLYIFESSINADIKPGTEIASLNGLPAREVITKIFDGICVDGYNLTFKYYSLNADMFPNFYTNTFGRQDSIEFEFKGPEKKTIKIKSILPPPGLVKYLPTRLPLYYFSKDKSQVTITIGSFGSTIQPDYQTLFNSLKTYGTKTLVLNLRDNLGGEPVNATKLFSYLISKPQYFARVPKDVLNDPKKTPKESLKIGITSKINPAENSFQGKIYLIVNGGSFSATAILAANLQASNKDIVIVGEETGGGREGCTGGLFKQTQIEGSNLSLRYGQVPFKSFKEVPQDGKGVMPTHEIKYTIQDYLLNRDLELEWVFNNSTESK